MATLGIEPSNRVMPGSQVLPSISFPDPINESVLPTDPESVVATWASSFSDLIKAGQTDVSKVFLGESYWRDLLCLTWDFHTVQGPQKIRSFVESLESKWRIKSISVDTSSDLHRPTVAPLDFSGKHKCIHSFITIETDVGSGSGFVRLLPDKQGVWKCYTMLTVLQKLAGHEEQHGAQRPQGVDNTPRPGRLNWKDKRAQEENLEGDQPAVLVVGCGQAGLTVAARLKQVGVKTLIVDRARRIGDGWRDRYHHLVLHDPVWFDHMPYLDFPPQWPVFTPKDKLADWFEVYAKTLELNVWTSTTIQKAEWSSNSKEWTVSLERKIDGVSKTYELQPRHVILATGASGKPLMPSIPGLESFQGSRLVHSAEFPGLPPEISSESKGKKVLIIGSCNSSHDIAQDYHEHGYDVTMVQRSSTLVVNGQTVIDVMMNGLYCEGGPPTDDADMINHSFPWPVVKRFHVDVTDAMAKKDRDLLKGLQSAGFSLDSGPGAAGLWIKYLSRGGGYYIDTGCSALIANGDIRVKSSSITRINAQSVTFEDGTELGADEIIFATGYSNMQDTAADIFGQEVADKAGPVWGFDEEWETRGVWRRSGLEGFWYMAGNLALCRFYSKRMALAIKGLEEGLWGWGDP